MHNKQRQPNAQEIEVHISNELKRATKQETGNKKSTKVVNAQYFKTIENLNLD